MKYAVWGLIALLIVLHQDAWFWEDSHLLFGVLPVGLAYHVGISVAAAITWYLATLYCWPRPDEVPNVESDGFHPVPTTAGDDR